MRGIRERLPMGEATLRTEAYCSQLPYLKMMGVEAVGGGKEFARGLLRSTTLPIHECLPSDVNKAARGKSKIARIQNWMAPYFQFGRASLSDAERAFITHFENEWLMFDGTTGHDDCLDAVLWAMWVAARFGGLVMRHSNSYVAEITNPMYKTGKKKASPYAGLGAYRG